MVDVAQSLVFCVLSTLLVFYFFLSLYCMSFFILQSLVTTLISSYVSVIDTCPNLGVRRNVHFSKIIFLLNIICFIFIYLIIKEILSLLLSYSYLLFVRRIDKFCSIEINSHSNEVLARLIF